MPMMADEVLDCRGLACPLPILKTRKAVDGLRAGQVLMMLATDPATIVDIQAWTRKTGHQLLEYVESQDGWTFYIRKAA